MEERKIERGQVYFLREDDSVGAELSIGRPVLVLNNQELIDKLPTVVVAYMTTTPKVNNSTVKVFTGKRYSYVVLNQLRTIDKSRLTEFMCKLTTKEMERVNTALSYVMAIGEFLPESEEEVVEVKDTAPKSDVNELAELKMELALHKALYEKTLEKLIELRLEKDQVTVVEKPVVVEPPKDVWVDEPQLDLAALQEKFNVYDQKAKKAPVQQKKRKNIPQAPLDYDGPIGNARLIDIGRKLNINTANYDDFRSIGMGDGVSRKIIYYRKKHGKFSCLEELLNVSGFGRGSYVVYTPGLTV